MSKRKALVLLTGITISVILMNLSCEWPWGKFKRNPNLSLFLTANFDTTFFLSSFFLPRFSQDGRAVYFLAVKDDDQSGGFIRRGKGGNLFKINLDSTQLTLIRGGKRVKYYTFSHDYQKIFVLEDSTVKIINLEGSVIDSLPIIVKSNSYFFYSGFDISSNGEWLYYCMDNNYYKFNLATRENISLFQHSISYFEFDLSPDDSLLLIGTRYVGNNTDHFIFYNLRSCNIIEVALPADYFPATSSFSPSSSDYILFPKAGNSQKSYNDLALFNISTKNIQLMQSTITNKLSVLLYPTFSQDARKIIFSGSSIGRRIIYFEIWILNNVKIGEEK